MTVAVITISDRASRGEYEDLSGPEIEKLVKGRFADVTLKRCIVPDEAKSIVQSLEEHEDADFILTTGGTGIGPRDITPEVTEQFCDRALPGIAEKLRAESYNETRTAMLSRGYAGLRGKTIVVNFPGSIKAVRLCCRVIMPVMEHALAMLRAEGH